MEPNILELILDGKEEPTNIPFALLANITGNFSKEREIGRDEFGAFYKGVLPNGNVTVKRIAATQFAIPDNLFCREVDTMMEVNHKNIIRFLGYCFNTERRAVKIQGSRQRIHAEIIERLLCFEHISVGGLHNYITDELRGLEWNTRYQIIKELCNGLNHLHKEKQIIHMDLKPHNILLDIHMVPKVTGFTLSRIMEHSMDFTKTTTGTWGYIAPEYIHSGKMSFKSDMYSLGVVIMEIVTGQKNLPNKNNVLRRWKHRWRKSGKETPWAYQQVTKCIKIAQDCLEQDPDKRPFIWDIISDINLRGFTNEQTSHVGEQIGRYLEDDMLAIEPLEIHFPFELNKKISCSLDLTNEISVYLAFDIRNTSPLEYCIEPNKGIVPPKSKFIVKITLQAQEKAPQHMQQAYAFILRSTKVTYGLQAEDITKDMFTEKAGNLVDEVNLDVVLDVQLQNELLHDHKLDLRFPLEPNNLTPIVFELKLLKDITSEFSTTLELGRGGYGVVYKGVFSTGEIIAVKKLKSHLVKDETFQSEVGYLAGIRHRNVVQFVGYCAQTSWELMPQPIGMPIWFQLPNRLICLEYVCNGSLRKYISDESTGLEWNIRYDIIKGICSGLDFLHEKCGIVHLDIKPENILMDDAMVPKIADFGLSKVFDNQKTHITVDIANRPGTRGYMAPEYTIKGLISKKADIFSLGAIIIEIVTGHLDYPLSSAYYQLFDANDDCPPSTDTFFQPFIEKVLEPWRTKFLSYPKHKSMERYTQQVKHCITVALKCVEPDRENRPTAKDILQWLTIADQENLSPTVLSDSNAVHHNYQEATMASSEPQSVTDATTEAIPGSVDVPGVHPLKQSFPFETNRLPRARDVLENNQDGLYSKPVVFKLEFLKEITQNFSKESKLDITHAVVYKGVLPSGKNIAVEELPKAHLVGHTLFQKSISYLSGCKHQNIVQFVGYCAESGSKLVEQSNGRHMFVEVSERFLCFEYVCNGSLDNYMHGIKAADNVSSAEPDIDWHTRFKIITGICQGLRFLHHIPIIHKNLRPRTVLLDADMVPKLAYFTLPDQEQTQLYTQTVEGLYEYMAPEYLYRGESSPQSDIYSLGLLIIVITTGETPFPELGTTSGRRFIEKVRQDWTPEHIASSKYASLDLDCLQQVRACIDIGLKCVEIDPGSRPSMREIVDMLN